MGRATRWLKNLFGIKKQKQPTAQNSNSAVKTNKNPISNFSCEICNNPTTIPPNLSTAEAAWLKSFYTETEQEQSKHAIAVAAATAAAADAAVAAAQAAVAVVRLTSYGRGTMFGGGKERWASVKIQTLFRGFLARKALKALKGLVKLQAVVRGYLIRKQAAKTLHSMQALIRAQSTVRSQRTRKFVNEESINKNKPERFENAIEESPKIVEMDTGRIKSWSRRTNTSAPESDKDPFSETAFSPLPSRKFHDSDWGFTGDGPPTPAKSMIGENFFAGYLNFPNYMTKTESFKAKLRSQSAPKQRAAEIGGKRRISLNELMGSRNSLSGDWMQRSCSHVHEAVDFKNVVMRNLDKKPLELHRRL